MICGVNKFNRRVFPLVNVMISVSVPICVDWILQWYSKVIMYAIIRSLNVHFTFRIDLVNCVCVKCAN